MTRIALAVLAVLALLGARELLRALSTAETALVDDDWLLESDVRPWELWRSVYQRDAV